MKFHAMLHLVEDMILFGVPSEFDTGSNESHHKASKYAARVTQRKEAVFHMQTAKRLTEFLILDHAKAEIEADCCLWEYFDVDGTNESSSQDTDVAGLTGDLRDMSHQDASKSTS